MKKKMGLFAATLALLAGAAYAASVAFSGLLVNEAGLAYNQTYVFDLNAHSVGSLSAQAVYSSATFAAASFSDGTVSTGSVRVVNNAALSSATATNSITILSTAGAHGVSVVTQGSVLREGVNWSSLLTASATAISLASALNQVPGIQAHAANNVVYATAASYGIYYNSFLLSSSSQTAVSVLTPTFTGGRDNAVFSLAGFQLRQGLDWFVGNASSNTAKSLSAAINSVFGAYVASTFTANGVVYTTSTMVGPQQNFLTFTSTQAALALNAPQFLATLGNGSASGSMTGGTSAGYGLNVATITIPNHGWTLGLPVLFSTAGAGVGGLATQTTYYVIPIDANRIELATTSARAVAGQFLTLTSSAAAPNANSYALAPLAIAGLPSFKWQASNDGANWLDLAVSSVTVYSYQSNPPASTGWDFGLIDFKAVRLNVVAPTAGGLSLQVSLNAHP